MSKKFFLNYLCQIFARNYKLHVLNNFNILVTLCKYILLWNVFYCWFGWFSFLSFLNQWILLDLHSFVLSYNFKFSGLDRKTAREKILAKLKLKNIKVYPASGKLRDWLISRQRYWGTPIPIINCSQCGVCIMNF